MKYLFSIIFILLILYQKDVIAQKKHYIPFGAGISYVSIQDFGQSPLIYRGAAFNTHIGYFNETENYIDRNLFLFQVGGLMNKHQDEFATAYFRGDYSYIHVQKVKAFYNDQLEYYLGGQIAITGNSRINSRIANIAFGYDISESLGISNWLKYKVDFWGMNLRLDYNLNIPLLSYIMRPSYTSLFDFTNPDAETTKEIVKNGKLVSFGKYFRINSQASISYFLKNGNAFLLTYNWDYYGYNQVNKVKAAYHAIYITTLFNL